MHAYIHCVCITTICTFPSDHELCFVGLAVAFAAVFICTEERTVEEAQFDLGNVKRCDARLPGLTVRLRELLLHACDGRLVS